ncbi:MAG: gamma-glutamyltransferase [Anaerolineae bacterium]
MTNFEVQFNSRRSNVIGRNGMVATSQPLAAQAGIDILRAGGNAIDAAIATVSTLCVTEPCSTGIGGDAFALIWSAADQRLFGLNASGPAPAGLTADHVRILGHTEFPALGGLAVTVPGALRGWEMALSKFGSLPLSRILDSAITYARDGYPVSEKIASQWSRSHEKMSRHADSKRVWLPFPGGRGPNPGEMFSNPEVAATLQKIVDKGYDAFYTGDIAQQIADCVQADGGFLSTDDLANYKAEWVEPISVEYRPGYRFFEIPPNGQGLTALLALNIMKGFDVQAMGHGTYEYTHTMMEAIKLAFADAHAYIADPKHAQIPLAGLLSDSYTETRRGLIDSKSALTPMPGQPQQHGDTVYLTVADEAGNMVSWIQSLYMGFGSGLTAGTTGVQLQNRGANFSLEEGHPNEAAGGKRPFHTIIPGFITKNDQAWASFGVMGGFMQPQGHLQVGSSLVDFDMSPQAALDAPRFYWQKDKLFALEPSFGERMYAEMRLRGHQLMPVSRAETLHYGGGQAIIRDIESGVYVGGAEPRNDGTAAGY